MKQYLLLTLFIGSICFSAAAQVTDTVSIGANYKDRVWFNLENEVQTTVKSERWDFGFQINGIAASILANTAYGAKLYPYPNGDTSDWANMDTSSFSNWKSWYNSPSDWNKGAFNRGIDTSNQLDLGWGKYSFNTHSITGDSLFIWETANGGLYKIWIKELASSKYRFLVANLSGTKTDTVSIDKTNFNNKDFAYYSIANDTILDLAPTLDQWDLIFGKYIEDLGIPYPVTGIRTNKLLQAAKVYPVADPSNYTDINQNYSEDINIIGHDWKSFDLNNSVYKIKDSTVYFIKADSTTYWKLIMKDFGGSSNGNFVFQKTKIKNTSGLFESKRENEGNFLIYPNPVVNNKISIVVDLPKTISTVNLKINAINGQLVQREQLQINHSFEAHQLKLNDLEKGIYFVRIQHKSGQITKKLIVK